VLSIATPGEVDGWLSSGRAAGPGHSGQCFFFAVLLVAGLLFAERDAVKLLLCNIAMLKD
jgi:hypothetical protein